MFYRCICGVLADKLVILVTHQLQYVQHADHILVLKEVCASMTKEFTMLLCIWYIGSHPRIRKL